MVWDPTWERVFKTQGWGKYPGEDLIRFVSRNFSNSVRSEVRILELGCGPGANIWYLAREGFSAYGVDGSETAIHQCKARLKAENLVASVSVGDVTKLDFDDEMFDAVVDVECLYCNQRAATEEALRESARVLKAGGKLYSRTFAEGMFLGDGYRTLAPLEFDNISEGPMAGKGFVRLADEKSIRAIYGQCFIVDELETMSRTIENRKWSVPEWQITCTRR